MPSGGETGGTASLERPRRSWRQTGCAPMPMARLDPGTGCGGRSFFVQPWPTPSQSVAVRPDRVCRQPAGPRIRGPTTTTSDFRQYGGGAFRPATQFHRPATIVNPVFGICVFTGFSVDADLRPAPLCRASSYFEARRRPDVCPRRICHSPWSVFPYSPPGRILLRGIRHNTWCGVVTAHGAEREHRTYAALVFACTAIAVVLAFIVA